MDLNYKIPITMPVNIISVHVLLILKWDVQDLTITGQELTITGQELTITGQELTITGQDLTITGQDLIITGRDLTITGQGDLTITDQHFVIETLIEIPGILRM
jgi:hypothetical protein